MTELPVSHIKRYSHLSQDIEQIIRYRLQRRDTFYASNRFTSLAAWPGIWAAGAGSGFGFVLF
jgi:hypothetical protein